MFNWHFLVFTKVKELEDENEMLKEKVQILVESSVIESLSSSRLINYFLR